MSSDYLLEPSLCARCWHYVYIHPCTGWHRKPWLKIGPLLLLRRCRCRKAV